MACVPQWRIKLWLPPDAAAERLYVLQGSCGVADNIERTRRRRNVVGAAALSRRCSPQAREWLHRCNPLRLMSMDGCLPGDTACNALLMQAQGRCLRRLWCTWRLPWMAATTLYWSTF